MLKATSRHPDSSNGSYERGMAEAYRLTLAAQHRYEQTEAEKAARAQAEVDRIREGTLRRLRLAGPHHGEGRGASS